MASGPEPEEIIPEPINVYSVNALAKGNKVLCVSEGKFGAAPGEHVAFYDIFRLENGKIVEHWDNIQTIPADGQWANPNGKFGF